MDKNKILNTIRELEINYIDDEANSYWDTLEHDFRIDFLTNFIATYFKFHTIYNIYDQPESYDIFKDPISLEIDEKKWMAIIYKETEIILKLIMTHTLTGETIKENLITTRCPGFDGEFHHEVNNGLLVSLPFLTNGYNIKYIIEDANPILAKIDNPESLLSRMEYFIFAAYNKIILRKDYAEIAKEYNKKYIDNNIDSDLNTTEVKKTSKSCFTSLEVFLRY